MITFSYSVVFDKTKCSSSCCWWPEIYNKLIWLFISMDVFTKYVFAEGLQLFATFFLQGNCKCFF